MRTLLLLLLIAPALSCKQPRSGGDRALIGSFVGGAIRSEKADENRTGISLRGHFGWHAAIRSSPEDEARTGISLRGSLR